jgi:xylan 1,4-beta-xylosidase
MNLEFRNVPPDARVSIQRVDGDHGNVLKEYEVMGRPLDPTADQVEQLNHRTALPAPEDARLQGGKMQLTLTPDALVLIRVEP